MCVFQDFPGLFNRMDIEQVRLSYTRTKSVTLCTQFHLSMEYNQNVELKRKSVEFRYEKCGVKNFAKHTRVRNAATIWFIFQDFP